MQDDSLVLTLAFSGLAVLVLLIAAAWLLMQWRPTRSRPPSPDEVQRRHTEALLALYDRTGAETDRWVRITSIAKPLRWSTRRTKSVLTSLADIRYAEVREGGKAVWDELLLDPPRARLTGEGQKAAMRIIENPTRGDKDLAPAATVINVTGGVETLINQAGNGHSARVASRGAVLEGDRHEEDIRQFLAAFQDAMLDAPLATESSAFARQNIEALLDQVDSRQPPNPAIRTGALAALTTLAREMRGNAAWDLVRELGSRLL